MSTDEQEPKQDRRHTDFRLQNVETVVNKLISRVTILEKGFARLNKWFKAVDLGAASVNNLGTFTVNFLKLVAKGFAIIIPIVTGLLAIAAFSEDVSVGQMFDLIKSFF